MEAEESKKETLCPGNPGYFDVIGISADDYMNERRYQETLKDACIL